MAAISAGGAGAVFWMWVTALIGSSTAFIEGTLAQLYKEKDPLYGGYRGGPAYYIHKYLQEKRGGKIRRYCVLAISAGGAGAVFWMWVTALIGSSTAFIEGTLAQLYKEKDPLYGGYRGGPAYYIHKYLQEKRGGKIRRYCVLSVLFAVSGLICWCGISQVISNSVSSAFENAFHIPPLYSTIALVVLAAVIVLRKNATVKYRGGPAYYIHKYLQEKRGGKVRRYCGLSVLFAISGLICWCGISQVISNSVSSAFENAFHIPPLYSTIALVVLAAVIVLRKNATVKVLDVMVPIMAGCYLLITVLLIVINFRMIPSVIGRIFQEAFGFRQVVAGGFGAVLMNGVKRGLFSNEAGSGSAPCAAATAETDHPAKVGLGQALGVFIDTILICSCTAMIMLVTPETLTQGLTGMDLLQEAMRYHLGTFGVVFIAITLWLFSFSTFVGILFYARSNVAYLFGDNWFSQTAYKIVALAMLFVGGLAAYTVVWDLGDVGVGLMTLFNIFILFPMSKKAIDALKDYEKKKKA